MAVKDGVTVEKEETEDGLENETDPENNADGLKPVGTADPDGGKAPGENGEDGGENENPDGTEKVEEEPVEDPRDAKIAELEASIKEIKERSAKPEEKEAQPKVYTETEKAEIEQRFGGAPFEQVQAFTRVVATAIGRLREEFQGQFGRTDKAAVISELSKQKEFADIQSYASGIDEFLKKLNPSLHGNKELLQDAYFWAKGRGLKKTVAKAVNSNEKNKRIAGPARPAAPSGKAPAKGALKFKLSPTEESAYLTYKDNFSSKEDYARSLSRYKNPA